MMASRELTASRAHPPEHSTALVWNTHNAQHLDAAAFRGVYT